MSGSKKPSFSLKQARDLAESWNGEFYALSEVICSLSSFISHVLYKTKMADSGFHAIRSSTW